MRSSILSATTVVLAGLNLVDAQTFTDCDPTKKTCPPNPGLGGKLTTDFTQKSSDWTESVGTTLTYGPNGAEFNIKSKTGAPTIGVNKYIQFGKVSVTMKAAPGTGVISSFILESQDLDEIDFEWVGGDVNNVQSNFFGKGNTTTYDRSGTHPVSNPMTEFVTYAIDWNKDSIKFYAAGNMVRELLYNDPKTHGGFNYPQTPMRVKMGAWVGCPDAAAAASEKLKYTCEWAGGPLPENPDFTMYVKSVSIEDYGCGGDYTYSDLSGSYQSIKSSGTCDGKVDESTPTKPTTSSASATATATSRPGGVLVETSVSVSTKTTATGTAAAATKSPNDTSSGSNNLATTATAPTGTSASPTTSGAPTVTANAASSMKPKHKYGVLDMGVMALGLGLGYLVM
ncbi:related to cell wall protein (putative glycosidase) [Rhynchosporium agropyri]|uniref:chitinase n=1 Tax=Rhynchosporium agropyri TaxID=914238 RepID=A0A1E1KQ17_9HELO|nr:related to cell wall protein (putative glycosidase) [Rhynchosporium agropyri]